jgi:hypothetical protein
MITVTEETLASPNRALMELTRKTALVRRNGRNPR